MLFAWSDITQRWQSWDPAWPQSPLRTFYSATGLLVLGAEDNIVP